MSVTHITVGNIRRIALTLTADASGAFAMVTLPTFEGTLLSLRSGDDPWIGVAPPANWSVEIFDQHGLDLLETVGVNRSASTAQGTVIRFAGKDLHPVVTEMDTLRLKISGNVVPYATIPITLIYATGYAP